MTSNTNRRTLLKAGTALAAAAAFPALGQGRTKVKVGYLHTPAVDAQIWTGQQIGSFAKSGLDLELVQFTTGLELFQAMIGGSLDMLSTGAVVSNFPARGQGKVFLINNIEYATAQLWVSPDIKTVADLKGQKISTTAGTTAHVFLDKALRAANLDPAKDVQIVNQRMAEAVTSFVSGAVPAVALWVPFDVTVRQKVQGARKLVDASAFYPQAAIIGGWATRAD
jgi:NitT/TauT family transport system substrate-binding protein